MSPQKFILYNSTPTTCPYAQRVAIALKEVGVDYEEVPIDLQNKPDWYAVKVNPDSKVPALDIDGKIYTESLVLIELVNDLFPEKNLLPKDPFQRAQIRFATELFSNKVWSQFFPVLQAKITKEEFLEQVEPALIRLNGLLVEQSQTGPYFLGDQFSLADISLGPFIARILATASLFEKEKAFQFDAVKQNPRLAEFFKGVVSRPSFKDTYIGDQAFTELISKRFSPKF